MIIDIDSVYSFRQLGMRDNQEDSRFPDLDEPGKDNATFVVCDGVGGCEKGEVASAAVCERIGKVMDNHKNTDTFSTENFSQLLGLAYDALDEASNPSNKGMGTTLTFLTLHSDGALAAHIGDSRIYQIRPHEGIIYKSEDHSLVNALLRSGNISPEQVKNHPKSNVITRCMSANDGVRERDDATVINLDDVATGDYFLLCSDGVTAMIDDEELIELYSSDKADEEKFKYVAEKCKESSDNNTFIQIHIGLVTINPEYAGQDSEEIDESVVATQQLKKRYTTVKDVSPEREHKQSKLKSFFSKIFG